MNTLVPREERKNYKLNNGRILIIGDLHLTNRKRGRHISYENECCETMNKIMGIIKEEKPTAIFLLGDLIGYSDTRILDEKFLTKVLNFFSFMARYTKGHLYSVKGNHDIAEVTQFDLLEGLNTVHLQNPNFVDFVHQDATCTNKVTTRFHFVNYGEEDDKLDLLTGKYAYNIVLGHNDYAVEGVTDWYKSSNSVYVKDLHNFAGIDGIISGHIHAHSDEDIKETIDGKWVWLMYPGSPCRAASTDKHDQFMYIVISYPDVEDIEPDMELTTVDLTPISELLVPVEEKSKTIAEQEDEIVQQRLEEIVQELGGRRHTDLDFEKQVAQFPYFKKEARDKATETYRAVKNTVGK